MSDHCAKCDCKLTGFFGTLPSKNNPTFCIHCAPHPGAEANEFPETTEKRRSEALGAERRANADTLAKEVLVSTTDSIFGRQIASHIGIARGGTVRAKNAISDIGAGIKNLVGGEMVAYTTLLADAREQAIHRMKVDAAMLKADAVIGVNFSTSMIDVGAAEITAFGTAVTLEKVEGDD